MLNLNRKEIAFIIAIVTGIVVGTAYKKSYCRYADRTHAGIDCVHADG